VKGVRQRLRVAGEHLDRLGEQRRLAAARAPGMAADAHDVTEQHVDLAGLRRLADHLDAAGAVDDVEEDELAHVTARHRAARDPAARLRRLTRLERLTLLRTAAISARSGKRLGGVAELVIGPEPRRPAEAGRHTPRVRLP